MNLIQALRLNSKMSVALVGAGGKSTALFDLARNYTQTIWLTTSTHLSLEQIAQAEVHIQLSENSLDGVNLDLKTRKILFTGPLTEDGSRYKGPTIEQLDWLGEHAASLDIPLIIEADGARRLPLKAPGEHEPVIPKWCNLVCVCAGLSGINQPLDADHVYRPVEFSKLSGLQMDQKISPQAIVQVLLSPLGGLKNIPPKAKKVCFLNLADSAELRATAGEMAEELLNSYEAVIIASQMLSETLAGLENPAPQSDNVYTVIEKTAGIILAAGGATRMGRSKALLEWHKKPFIIHCVIQALQAGLNPVVVIAGDNYEVLKELLINYPVQLLHNPDWKNGQSSSIRLAVDSIKDKVGAAIFELVDQPQIPADLLNSLKTAHYKNLAPIIAPLVDGKRANPVLFDRASFPELLKLQGDVGGRALFSKFPVEYLGWLDERILLDVDTEADYQKLLETN